MDSKLKFPVREYLYIDLTFRRSSPYINVALNAPELPNAEHVILIHPLASGRLGNVALNAPELPNAEHVILIQPLASGRLGKVGLERKCRLNGEIGEPSPRQGWPKENVSA